MSRSYDPRLMALRGRVGAYAAHARHGGHAMTAAAREAFNNRWETQVDPDGTLTAEERRRRAHFARREHFARLALLSATARRNKSVASAARPEATQAEVDGVSVRPSKTR